MFLDREKKLSFCLSLFLLSVSILETEARTHQFIVYGIHSRLPMSGDEKIAQDYYLNVGTRDGIKEGSYLQVTRSLSTTDQIHQSQHDISVPFAVIKVIEVNQDRSVARLYRMREAQAGTVLDVESVNTGDQIEIITEEQIAKLSGYQDPLVPRQNMDAVISKTRGSVEGPSFPPGSGVSTEAPQGSPPPQAKNTRTPQNGAMKSESSSPAIPQRSVASSQPSK